ncbi:MAG: hypothetical protein HQL72_02585 [Magnetococcales bacterium]|nr:hypothetical protein [Magnetococcales bacterium]
MRRSPKETVMNKKWDGKMVAARLEEAATTMKRLPDEQLQQLKSNWPETIPTWGDYGDEKTKLRLGPPTPDAIDRMDEVMEWLRWLEPENIRLLWLRAERVPWKLIMRKFGVARSTINSRWQSAIFQIVAILNLPKKMSGHLSTGHSGRNLP